MMNTLRLMCRPWWFATNVRGAHPCLLLVAQPKLMPEPRFIKGYCVKDRAAMPLPRSTLNHIMCILCGKGFGDDHDKYCVHIRGHLSPQVPIRPHLDDNPIDNIYTQGVTANLVQPPLPRSAAAVLTRRRNNAPSQSLQSHHGLGPKTRKWLSIGGERRSTSRLRKVKRSTGKSGKSSTRGRQNVGPGHLEAADAHDQTPAQHNAEGQRDDDDLMDVYRIDADNNYFLKANGGDQRFRQPSQQVEGDSLQGTGDTISTEGNRVPTPSCVGLLGFGYTDNSRARSRAQTRKFSRS